MGRCPGNHMRKSRVSWKRTWLAVAFLWVLIRAPAHAALRARQVRGRGATNRLSPPMCVHGANPHAPISSLYLPTQPRTSLVRARLAFRLSVRQRIDLGRAESHQFRLVAADDVADDEAAGVLSAVDGTGSVIINRAMAHRTRQPQTLPILPVPFIVGGFRQQWIFA
jgi:hypothetical protein